MAKLEANLCVNCRIPVGYVTEGALQIPTLCILCASDEGIMEEWEHEINPNEKNIEDILKYYRTKTMERVGVDWRT